mmetsp:Transcript_9102/g.27265  ORF Transcript_9102/g.27265 Transcript_9102/m.27265 type:complete len:131 (-) Transcript_9102:2685-3077(-)
MQTPPLIVSTGESLLQAFFSICLVRQDASSSQKIHGTSIVYILLDTPSSASSLTEAMSQGGSSWNCGMPFETPPPPPPPPPRSRKGYCSGMCFRLGDRAVQCPEVQIKIQVSFELATAIALSNDSNGRGF